MFAVKYIFFSINIKSVSKITVNLYIKYIFCSYEPIVSKYKFQYVI